MHNQHVVNLKNCEVFTRDYEIVLVKNRQYHCGECNFTIKSDKRNQSILLRSVRDHVLFHKDRKEYFSQDLLKYIEEEICYAQRIEECEKEYQQDRKLYKKLQEELENGENV